MSSKVNWRKAQGRPWDIYSITNLINHKVYIGQTKQRLQTRFSQHLCPRSACGALRAAVNKYGKENFELMKITTAATQEEADMLERLWIRLYRSNDPKRGYNQTDGGRGNGIGFTDEVKTRMSHERVGARNPFYGKHHSEESKRKMHESHAGQRHYWQEKPVVCIDTGELFESIKEAALAKGLNSGKIGDVCRGARKSTGGTYWRYA